MVAFVLVTALLMPSISTVTLAAEPISDENRAKYQEIIKEVAYSYLRQGTQIHYDQTATPPKRNIIISPEEATEQRRIFLDCSSFVNNVYYETFGIHVIRGDATTWSIKTAKMLNDANSYPNRRENEGYWTQDDLSSKSPEELAAFFEDLYTKLEVGDVMVYEHASGGGHTLVYVGDGTFVHCTGTTGTASPKTPSAYYDKAGVTEYEQGAVLEYSAFDLFKNPESSRYLGLKKRFCIIRPLDRTDIEIKPTEKSSNRLTIKGLAMEKVSSVHPDNCVDTNDEITYTVTLKNTCDTALSGVTLTDVVPAGTEFVSGDVTNNSGSLSATCDIAEGETKTISYTVKVTTNVAGTVIKSDSTSINGVTINIINHTVAGYSANDRAQVAAKAKEYAQNGRTFRDGVTMITTAYKDAIGADAFGMIDDGVNISAYSTADEILTEIIDNANYTCHTQTELSKMLVPHMFGGVDITYTSKVPLDGYRRSYVSVNHLALGDVILADHKDGELAYLYVGNSQFVKVEDGVCSLITTNEEYVSVSTDSSTYFRSSPQNKLVSLIAYGRFAVLRPSMQPATSELTVTGIEITTPPTKLVYDSGDAIDTTGMTVTATMSDGTKRNVTNFALSNDIISYPQTSVDVIFGAHSATLNGLEAKIKAFNVSELKEAPTKTDIRVEGIYVGIGSLSTGSTTDTFRPQLLLKDVNTNDTIAVAMTSNMYTISNSGKITMEINPIGIQKGDKLSLAVQMLSGDANYSTANSGRKYLSLIDSEVTSFADFVVSSGNSTSYDLSKAIVISTWEDMQNYYSKSNTLPYYSLVQFTGSSYMRANSSKIEYYVHKNDNYSAAADSRPDGEKNVAFRRYVLTTNIGANWLANGVFGTTNVGTSGIGTEINKDIYAIYLGNVTSSSVGYFQHTILDTDWISENKCYIESVSEDNTTVNLIANAAGNYKLYFADYDGNKLNELYPLDVTITAKGRTSVEIPENFTATSGDKIFFWESSVSGITPLTKAYIY